MKSLQKLSSNLLSLGEIESHDTAFILPNFQLTIRVQCIENGYTLTSNNNNTRFYSNLNLLTKDLGIFIKKAEKQFKIDRIKE